jgi:hypothetical protein
VPVEEEEEDINKLLTRYRFLNLKKNPQNHKKELLEKGDATGKLTDQKG